MRDVVFQYGVDDDFVQSGVLELIAGGGTASIFELRDESSLPFAADGRVDVQDVGFEPNHAFDGLQGVAIDFDDEEVLAMGRACHADFEEKSRPFYVQSVGVEMVEEDLLGEKHAAELGEVAVNMVELLDRQGGFEVVERVAEGGFLAFEVADDLR